MGQDDSGAYDNAHKLTVLISALTFGKPYTVRNTRLKAAFRYARQHGYKVAINRYQGYLNRKGKTMLD